MTYAAPEVDLPVLDHHWRLLLAEGRRYRFHDGTFCQVAGGPLEEAEASAVSGGHRSRARSPGSRRPAEILGWVESDDARALPGATVQLSPADRVGTERRRCSGSGCSGRAGTSAPSSEPPSRASGGSCG